MAPKPDFAEVNVADNNVGVFVGNGDGTFASPQYYGVGDNPVSVAAADLNHDGKLDLVVANQHSASLSILPGNGNGTFRDQLTVGVGQQPRKVVIDDFNLDGAPDIAVTNFQDNTVGVLLGNGDLTFQPPITYSVGTGPDRLAVGDLDRNGYSDLVVINSFSNNFTVLLNGADWGTNLAAGGGFHEGRGRVDAANLSAVENPSGFAADSSTHSTPADSPTARVGTYGNIAGESLQRAPVADSFLSTSHKKGDHSGLLAESVWLTLLDQTFQQAI